MSPSYSHIFLRKHLTFVEHRYTSLVSFQRHYLVLITVLFCHIFCLFIAIIVKGQQPKPLKGMRALRRSNLTTI